MRGNIVVFRDGDTPPNLIMQINNLAGALVHDPRPDMLGDYVVVDIVQIDMITVGVSYAVTAVLTVETYSRPAVLGEIRNEMGTEVGSIPMPPSILDTPGVN